MNFIFTSNNEYRLTNNYITLKSNHLSEMFNLCLQINWLYFTIIWWENDTIKLMCFVYLESKHEELLSWLFLLPRKQICFTKRIIFHNDQIIKCFVWPIKSSLNSRVMPKHIIILGMRTIELQFQWGLLYLQMNYALKRLKNFSEFQMINPVPEKSSRYCKDWRI